MITSKLPCRNHRFTNVISHIHNPLRELSGIQPNRADRDLMMTIIRHIDVHMTDSIIIIHDIKSIDGSIQRILPSGYCDTDKINRAGQYVICEYRTEGFLTAIRFNTGNLQCFVDLIYQIMIIIPKSLNHLIDMTIQYHLPKVIYQNTIVSCHVFYPPKSYLMFVRVTLPSMIIPSSSSRRHSIIRPCLSRFI